VTNVTFSFEIPRNTNPNRKKWGDMTYYVPPRVKKWGDTSPVSPTKLRPCLETFARSQLWCCIG